MVTRSTNMSFKTFPSNSQKCFFSTDEKLRTERVRERNLNLEDKGNPWDDKLSRDPKMGRRIIKVMEKMDGIIKIIFNVEEFEPNEISNQVN